MLNFQTYSNSSGLLTLIPLNNVGLPSSPTDITYLSTTARTSLANVASERPMLESSVGGIVGSGYQSVKLEFSFDAMDLDSKFISNTHGLKHTSGAANTSNHIISDSIQNHITSTGNGLLRTALGTATLNTNVVPGVYIARRVDGQTTIKYYRFTGSIFVEVPATDIFTTAPATTSNTTEISLQFKVSPPTTNEDKINLFQSGNNKTGIYHYI